MFTKVTCKIDWKTNQMKRFDEKCLLMREVDEYFGDPRKDLNIKVSFELKTLYNKSAFCAYCAYCAYVTAY